MRSILSLLVVGLVLATSGCQQRLSTASLISSPIPRATISERLDWLLFGKVPASQCPAGQCPGGVCPNGQCPNGQCPNGKCPEGCCPGGQCPRY